MNLIHELLNGVWLMDPDSARQYYPIVRNILMGLPNPSLMAEPESQARLAIFSNGEPHLYDADEILFDDEESELSDKAVFILDIIGPITKYNQMCGPVGMATKSQWLKHADQHPDIFAHVLRMDTPGGSGYACTLMQETFNTLQKPVFAYVEGMAASAGAWMLSNAAHVVLSSPMDQVGSIGTYIPVTDYRKYEEIEGVVTTEVYATKSVDKNRAYREAIDGNIEKMQDLADKYNEFFLDAIKKNRPDLAATEGKWGTGKMFFAQEAIDMGLAHEIGTLENLITNIFKEFKPTK